MPDERKINQTTLRILQGDITTLEVDAFVYYARPDLALGSGIGGAIAARGGPKIQEELKKLGMINTTEVVVSTGGNLKGQCILHAVGPRFQEEELEDKLRRTVQNVLRRAEELKSRKLAVPAMGAGFYGIPLDVSARITVGAVKEYLKNETSLEEVIFCLGDSRECKVFKEQLDKLS